MDKKIKHSSNKIQKKDRIRKISDSMVAALLPSVFLIWDVFLWFHLAIALVKEDYSVYATYAQITLTLFGFTLLGTFFGYKKANKDEISKLVRINLGFLLSTISFLIIYAVTSFISIIEEITPHTKYIIVGVFFIFSFLGIFGLIVGTMSLYRFLYKYK